MARLCGTRAARVSLRSIGHERTFSQLYGKGFFGCPRGLHARASASVCLYLCMCVAVTESQTNLLLSMPKAKAKDAEMGEEQTLEHDFCLPVACKIHQHERMSAQHGGRGPKVRLYVMKSIKCFVLLYVCM